MNQIIRVGDGLLVLFEQQITGQQVREFGAAWRDRFPSVPCGFMTDTQYVELPGGEPSGVFMFKGETVTQEIIDEFRSWWDARQQAVQIDQGG